MAKTAQTRIDEAVNAIVNANCLNWAARTQVAFFVSNAFPRLTAPDLQAFAALTESMSVNDNIMRGVVKGTSAQRQQRRAIMLIWKALGLAYTQQIAVTARANTAMSLPPASLEQALSDAIYKAATVVSVAGGGQVFNELHNNTVAFLGRYRLVVTVAPPDGGARFSTAPDGNYQNVQDYHLQYDIGTDKFVMRSAADGLLGLSHSFQTVVIPAVHWTTVPGAGAFPCTFTDVRGAELTGATFMLTTQFTGCAFSYTNHGGVIRASHISPAGGGPGVYNGGGNALAQRLMVNGTMGNAGNTALSVFGAGAGNAPVVGGGDTFYPNPQNVQIRWVTIIGTSVAGNWSLYTQVANGQEQIIQNRQIM